MRNRIVLITAATGGIGQQTAVELAKSGAQIVVTGRDAVRGKAAVDEITKASGNPSVDLLLGDLSSQQEVHRTAAEFQRRYDRLHVLVNNVGGLFGKRWETIDGIEGTIALNHLCPFLLTHLLLPLLRASTPSRVININSEGHRAASTVDFSSFAASRWKRGFPIYSQSKLANLMFTYELARRLNGTGVTVNAVHPGIVETPMVRRFVSEKLRLPTGILSRVAGAAATRIIRYIQRFDSLQSAARCPVYLASAEEVANTTGKYFNSDGTIAETSPASYDRDLALQVWAQSAELVKLASTNVATA